MKILLFVCMFLCVTISEKSYAKDFQARVLKVVDGDTVHVMHNNEKVKIRLYGIDAPEMNQAYGQESKQFLNALIADKNITVYPFYNDRYRRLVAMIWYEEKDIQAVLIENGFAWVYPKYCEKPICDTWKELEENARTKKIGLWGKESSEEKSLHVAPWEWRRWGE